MTLQMPIFFASASISASSYTVYSTTGTNGKSSSSHL
jgi:hypothetical protein